MLDQHPSRDAEGIGGLPQRQASPLQNVLDEFMADAARFLDDGILQAIRAAIEFVLNSGDALAPNPTSLRQTDFRP